MSRTRFFSFFLLVHILAYFFRVDRELYAVQDNFYLPCQTYNEQPFIEDTSSLGGAFPDFSKFSNSSEKETPKFDKTTIWRSVFLSYNSHVYHILKHNQPYSVQANCIVSVLYKQNISHKSSDEEEPSLQFFI